MSEPQVGTTTTDMGAGSAPSAPVVRLSEVSLRYGKTPALDAINLDIPAGKMVGLIGPDGVGKSSLFSLVAGAHVIQNGRVEVLGGDMAQVEHRLDVCPRIAYMPQGLGKNLYPTLSVFENSDFFARLFGYDRAERERRIGQLLQATALAPFPDRPASKLSGGMKQKLGLCCALIHDPDLLILDEPTTGVDPLSRRQFWELIDQIRATRPGMSVMVATAYMEEAMRYDWLVAMYAGKVLATGSPQELLHQAGVATLEEAFIALLPPEKRAGHQAVQIPPREEGAAAEIAIEARDLTKHFGDFVAVDHVNFKIGRGEIFGFLGANGCGKSTTMRMLTGLLPPTEGQALLFGRQLDPNDLATRRRVGYMSQAFSLYTELTVQQNLELHARLFSLPSDKIPSRVDEMAQRFGLTEIMDALPDSLPLGVRQRLQLAVAMIHGPDLLVLDEPTSGVDPVARDSFWQSIIVFGPDETQSNKLEAIYEVAKKVWLGEYFPEDADGGELAFQGRGMEMLSEHTVEGWLEGYLLTGRHGFTNSYEPFIHVIDSMFNQHAKWLAKCNELPWRAKVSSLNLLITGLVWRQDHNGFTHQDPGFLDVVANKSPGVVRIYLPPDANCLLSVADHCLKSINYVNVIVADKQVHPQYLDMEAAITHCTKGAGIWDWASNDQGAEPDVVMASCGDVPTMESLAATALLRQYLPDVKVRFVNVVDLFKLVPHTEHPHGMTDREFEALFTATKPVVFNFHSYPWLIHRLTYRRPGQHNIHVRGYKEQGNINTPLELAIRNQTDRFSLAIDAIDRMPRFCETGSSVREALLDQQIACKQHAYEFGVDAQDILCAWGNRETGLSREIGQNRAQPWILSGRRSSRPSTYRSGIGLAGSWSCPKNPL